MRQAGRIRDPVLRVGTRPALAASRREIDAAGAAAWLRETGR